MCRLSGLSLEYIDAMKSKDIFEIAADLGCKIPDGKDYFFSATELRVFAELVEKKGADEAIEDFWGQALVFLSTDADKIELVEQWGDRKKTFDFFSQLPYLLETLNDLELTGNKSLWIEKFEAAAAFLRQSKSET